MVGGPAPEPLLSDGTLRALLLNVRVQALALLAQPPPLRSGDVAVSLQRTDSGQRNALRILRQAAFALPTEELRAATSSSDGSNKELRHLGTWTTAWMRGGVRREAVSGGRQSAEGQSVVQVATCLVGTLVHGRVRGLPHLDHRLDVRDDFHRGVLALAQ